MGWCCGPRHEPDALQDLAPSEVSQNQPITPRLAQLLSLEPTALSETRRELIRLPKTPLSTPEPGRRTTGTQRPGFTTSCADSEPQGRTVVLQGVAVGRQEAFHTLAQEKLHIEQAAITEHRGEVVEFAQTLADAHQAMSGPIDLHAIVRFKSQFEESLVADPAYRDNEVLQDGSAACVTMFRAQTLKDLHSGVGMFFQPGDD
jgi:hypothetical protein